MVFCRYITHDLEERACLADFKSGLLSRFHENHPENVFKAAKHLLEYADSLPLNFALIEGPIRGTPSDPQKFNSFNSLSPWQVNFHSSYAVLPIAECLAPMPLLYQVTRHVREWIGRKDIPITEGFQPLQDEVRFFYHEDYSYGPIDNISPDGHSSHFPVGTARPQGWAHIFSGKVAQDLKDLMRVEYRQNGLLVVRREFIFMDKAECRDSDDLAQFLSSKTMGILPPIPPLQSPIVSRPPTPKVETPAQKILN